MAEEKTNKQNVSVSQGRLASQFYAYLSLRLVSEEKIGGKENKEAIVYLKKLKDYYDPKNWSGSCHGISILRLAGFLLDQRKHKKNALKIEENRDKKDSKEERWKKDIHGDATLNEYFFKVSVWNGKKESLTKELEQIFEQLLSWVGAFHNHGNNEIFHKEKIPKSYSKLSQEKRRKVFEMDHDRPQYDTYRQLEVFSKSEGILKPQKGESLTTLISDHTQLDFLIDILDIQGSALVGVFPLVFKKSLMFGDIYRSDIGHTVCAFKRSGNYYLFDPNRGFFKRDKEGLMKMFNFSTEEGSSLTYAFTVETFDLVKKESGVNSTLQSQKIYEKIQKLNVKEVEKCVEREEGKFGKIGVYKEIARKAVSQGNAGTLLYCLDRLSILSEKTKIGCFRELKIPKYFFRELINYIVKKNLTEYISLLSNLSAEVYSYFGLHKVPCDEDGNKPILLSAKYNAKEYFNLYFNYFYRNTYSAFNETNAHDETPIHLAARYLSFDVMKSMQEIFQKKKSEKRGRFQKPSRVPPLINKKDGFGLTPLSSLLKYNASDANAGRMIDILVEMGADVSLKLKNGGTLLHYAIQHGASSETICALLKAGVNPLVEDNLGRTSLNFALEKGNYQAINALLSNGVEAQASDILLAVKFGNMNVIAEYVGRGQNPNIRTEQGSMLFLALENEAFEIARCLAEHKPLPDSAALALAVSEGCQEIAQALLAVGTRPDLETEKRLLEMKTTLNVDDLFEAARLGSSLVIQKLASTDLNIGKQVDDTGKTALHIAVINGHRALVEEFLWMEEFDITLKDQVGKTALDYAKEKGDPSVLKALGVENEFSKSMQKSPLQASSMFKVVEPVQPTQVTSVSGISLS